MPANAQRRAASRYRPTTCSNSNRGVPILVPEGRHLRVWSIEARRHRKLREQGHRHSAFIREGQGRALP